MEQDLQHTPRIKWSVKRHVKQLGLIGMHCDTPESVPVPFRSGKVSSTLYNAMDPIGRLTLGVFAALGWRLMYM